MNMVWVYRYSDQETTMWKLSPQCTHAAQLLLLYHAEGRLSHDPTVVLYEYSVLAGLRCLYDDWKAD